MTTDREKIAELVCAVETVAFVLRGKRSKEAIEKLATYVARRLREIKDWAEEEDETIESVTKGWRKQ